MRKQLMEETVLLLKGVETVREELKRSVERGDTSGETWKILLRLSNLYSQLKTGEIVRFLATHDFGASGVLRKVSKDAARDEKAA